MTMRLLIIIIAVGFSTNTMAQNSSPADVGTTQLVQAKKQVPAGCKFVGTINGTKLWAGECVVSELRSSQIAAEAEKSLSERAAGAIPRPRQ
jgi:hypothetical protein